MAGIVLANAGVQAATVLGDPVPAAEARFAALVAGSLAAVVATVWAVQLLLSHRSWRASGILLAVVAIGVIAAALAGIAWEPLIVLVLLLGAVVLPGVAAGAGMGAGLRVFRSVPGRAILGALAVIVLCAVCWIAALMLGFFVTGPIAAFGTWVFFGAAGVAALAMWTRLWRRHGSGHAASGVSRGHADGATTAQIG